MVPETERFAKAPRAWFTLDPEICQLLIALDFEQGQFEGVQISNRQVAVLLGKDDRTAKRRIDKALASGHLIRLRAASGTAAAIYAVDNPSRGGHARPGYLSSRIGRDDTYVRSWDDTPDTARPDMDVRSTLTPQEVPPEGFPEREEPSPLPQRDRRTEVAVHGGAVREFIHSLDGQFPAIDGLPERVIAREIADALSHGWEPGPLGKRFAEMGYPSGGINHPQGFLSGRLRLVMSRHEPQRQVRRPPHCGDPDCPPESRLRTNEHGQAYRCPQCHPKMVGVLAPVTRSVTAMNA